MTTTMFKYIASLVTFIIFLVFTFIGDGVPEAKGRGFYVFAVNHFHSLTWFLLTICFVLSAQSDPNLSRFAKPIGLLSLVCYIVFRFALTKM
jgi:hypothetical protein